MKSVIGSPCQVQILHKEENDPDLLQDYLDASYKQIPYRALGQPGYSSLLQ